MCLRLSNAGQSIAATGEPVATGDWAESRPDGLVIQSGPERLATHVWAHLEGWADEDWRRRTGYLACVHDAVAMQLREGAMPARLDEVPHHEFCERYSMSWLDKPLWHELSLGL